MNPYSNDLMKRNDQVQELQIKVWKNMGGWGITPDVLELTGFFSSSYMSELNQKNLKKQDVMEIIYGGNLRFVSFSEKSMKKMYREVALHIERVLQMKKQALYAISTIEDALKQKVHDNSDINEILPDDMDPVLKEKIMMFQGEYIYAEDPDIAIMMLHLRDEFREWARNPGYYSALYATFNSMVKEMILNVTTMSLTNLSRRDSSPRIVENEATDEELERDISRTMNGEWK